MAPVLWTKDLVVGYRLGRGRTRPVLSDLALSLEPGDFVCLLGANGSGKSTLLRTLSSVQPPLSGTILLDGSDLARMDRRAVASRLSIVSTERVDAGLLRGYDLVALGRYPFTGWSGRLSADDHATVRWAIEATHSEELAWRPIGELSDGERQRVMVARALAQQPRLMLLDEPTAFLDLPRRIELTALIRSLARTTGLAVLMSTHDLELASRIADELWLVGHGGTFTRGAPEDLYLGGQLAATFGTDETVLDPDSGSFRPRVQVRGSVRLACPARYRDWVGRTLEREGISTVLDEMPLDGRTPAPGRTGPLVVIQDRPGLLDWRVEVAGVGGVRADGVGFRSLANAIRAIRFEP